MIILLPCVVPQLVMMLSVDKSLSLTWCHLLEEKLLLVRNLHCWSGHMRYSASYHSNNPLFLLTVQVLFLFQPSFFTSTIITCQHAGIALLKTDLCDISVMIFLRSIIIMWPPDDHYKCMAQRWWGEVVVGSTLESLCSHNLQRGHYISAVLFRK